MVAANNRVACIVGMLLDSIAFGASVQYPVTPRGNTKVKPLVGSEPTDFCHQNTGCGVSQDQICTLV